MYSTKEKISTYQRKWRGRMTPEQRAEVDRRAGLKKRYGITLEQWQTMWDAQNGKCAICHEPMQNGGRGWDRAAVDHCHKTGRVRTLLHGSCNTALGHLKDDPGRARMFLRYIEEHCRVG